MTFRVRELSPPGVGGVCVLSLEGTEARQRLRRIAPHRDPPVRVPVLVRLTDAGEDLDEALVLELTAERIEVHLHGSPLLVERVRAALGPSDAPGAATIEDRAASRLGSAACEAAARILLDQAEGALRRELERLIALPPSRFEAALAALLEAGRRARFALHPIQVVLAGPVNAGKSTLFNALVGHARAIVSAVPGTTRDLVSEPAQLGAWPVILSDTAGERVGFAQAAEDPAGEIERAGLRLARRLGAQAGLVLWLAAPGDSSPAPPGAVRITSRAGGKGDAGGGEPRISALEDPAGAARILERVFRSRFDLPPAAWVAGAAIPFEQAMLEDLRSLIGRPQAREATLTPWLAGRARMGAPDGAQEPVE